MSGRLGRVVAATALAATAIHVALLCLCNFGRFDGSDEL